MLHNLSGRPTTVDLQLDPAGAGKVEVLLGSGLPDLSTGRLEMELEPYGFRWAEHKRERDAANP